MLQRKYLTQLAQSHPMLVMHAPFDQPDGAVVRITGGKWVVDCSCGNCPAASPEWDIARCFECGAVFHRLTWPAEREGVEGVLLARPMQARHWRGQSVKALKQEDADQKKERIARLKKAAG